MALPRDFAQHVKATADIVRIVGESVRLKKTGNSYVGLCPFHQEKTPSFNVHQTKQFYYCFGCGAKGDVFRFVQETERVEFPEAVRRVAQRCGIPVPAEVPRQPDSPEEKLRGTLYELHERAAAFFREQLRSAEAAPVRELIERRGVTASSVDEFGLGYAPGRGSALADFLRKEGFTAELLESSGLVMRRDAGDLLDRFRRRWVFPIASETGKVIAFGARALGDDQPKYLNSPETPIYTKSRVLYNLARAREAIRKSNQAVLVEGYMDAIAAAQAGVANVVASCGTALTPQQVKLLARYGHEVIVSYDPDTAGAAATDRSLALLLEESLQVRIVRLPEKLDPDQFVKQKGAEAYRAAVQAAVPVFRYLAARALEVHGKASPDAKLAAVNFVLPYLTRVPNALIRSELMADIAQKLDVNSGVIWESFQKASMARRETLPALAGAPMGSASVGMSRIPAAEAMIVRLLLESEQARENVPGLLQDRELVAEMEAASIISGLLGMIENGDPVDLTNLVDRLEPARQKALAEIAFDSEARPVSYGEIDAYLNALECKRLQRERQKLQQKIRERQTAGDAAEMRTLLEAVQQLDRRLRDLV